MIPSQFVILGTLIGAVGGISYLIDTLKGKAKPNKVTFFLWSLAPLIAFAAEMKQGVGLQSLMTFSVGFLPLIILIASFFNKQAEWKITKFDVICGVFSVVGIILWMITKVGNVAIICSILADFLAAVPTILKSYKYPETENSTSYFTAFISGGITLLTIKQWNLGNYGFPLYIMLNNLLIFCLVYFKIGKNTQKTP